MNLSDPDDPKSIVKVEKINEPPVPEDYVYRRGREDQALDFVDETTEPPPGYLKLNLLSKERLPAYRNMNPDEGDGTDIVYHPFNLLNGKWPVEDHSVLAIKIGANICQLGNLELFMRECWRVLVNGGMLHVKAPYYTATNYFANSRNILPICDNTFSYFCVPWLKKEGIGFDLGIDFEILQRMFYYDEEWILVGDQARDYARRHYNNVVSIIEFKLGAVKPAREM